ncbi:MAG: mandelate racemase/muconate lactonizing enzyme family protein [Chloroflexota bacterium]|nr:mandelate racemase/muconate lactonizing enzyme family protein [Chloroflexota bacterium]
MKTAITCIDARHYHLPLTHPMTDASHGVMTRFDVVLVKLETASGLCGYGYTYTIGVGGAAIRALIESDLKPLLLGQDADRIERLWDMMWRHTHYVGRGGLVSFAMAAIDIALWDLKGKKENAPLWKLLGGYSGQANAYAGGIDLQLGPDELVEQTRCNIDKGFRAIKIKVGRDKLSEDLERVRAVRDFIGPDMPLMVDANMRWTVETATKAARKFRDYDVFWLEEPTIPDDYKGMARIARDGGLPVAAGENLHTVYEFRHTIEEGMIAFPEPDVSNIGGITNWMRVAKLAYAHNLAVTSHGLHEIHLHLLAAIPNASYLEVHSFGLERFMENPPELNEGLMRPSNSPGHGVLFDHDALRQFILS